MGIDDLLFIDQVGSKLLRIKIKAKGKRLDWNDVIDGVNYNIVTYIYKGKPYVDSVKSSVLA